MATSTVSNGNPWQSMCIHERKVGSGGREGRKGEKRDLLDGIAKMRQGTERAVDIGGQHHQWQGHA